MLRIPTVASSPLESPEVQALIRISLRDLASSTAQRIVLGVAGPLVLLQLFVAARWPGRSAYLLGQTTILLLATVILTLALERKQFRGAQIIWLSGYSLTIFLNIHLLGQSEVAVLLILVPLMAGMMLGGAAAIWSGTLVAITFGWLSHNGFLAPLNSMEGMMLVIAGSLTTLVAWLTTDALLTMTCQSLADAERVRWQIEEARERQVELEQIPGRPSACRSGSLPVCRIGSRQ